MSMLPRLRKALLLMAFCSLALSSVGNLALAGHETMGRNLCAARVMDEMGLHYEAANLREGLPNGEFGLGTTGLITYSLLVMKMLILITLPSLCSPN